MKQEWKALRERGSAHYRGGTQPIDLMKDGEILWDFAIGNILKYAYRNRREIRGRPSRINRKDMEKLKHYADMLLFLQAEDTENSWKPVEEKIEREASLKKYSVDEEQGRQIVEKVRRWEGDRLWPFEGPSVKG